MRPICPHCRHPMNVVGTRIDGQHRVRYYGCRCGHRAPAILVPLEHAPPRVIAMNSNIPKTGIAKKL